MKNFLVTIATALWIVAALLIFTPRPSYADSANGLCLTEPEFTDVNAMGQTDEQRLQAIRDWLDGLLPRSPKGAFLKGRNPDGTSYTFQDLDNGPTDPAQEISNAAKNNKINPRVLLSTLRKEKPRVFKDSRRPSNRALRTLAGCGSSPTAREQIQCMGRKLKEWFYDQLSQCSTTPGGWNVDVEKGTGDTEKNIFELNQDALRCSATPESKAVAVLYQYTPWKGRRYDGCGWGHPDYPEGAGGNGLFCAFWKQHGWQTTSPGPLTLSPQPLTMSCAPPTPEQPSRCLSINVSGGDPGPNGYSWSITGPNLTTTEGVLTVSGVTKQNVQLKPPDNPGANLAGTAYDWHTGEIRWDRFGNQCVHGDHSCRNNYGCNDQLLGSTSPSGHGFGCADASPPTCNQSCQDAVFGCPGNCGYPVNPGSACTDFESVAVNKVYHDVRTQGPDCRPCRLEMQGGVTVTVTDSAGTPVSTTATVK